ncbi:MAG: hypothetical protein K0Q76_2173 [Panacagrimonas sp.]|nr:hypothetical protein [Panacagrimonas sp.]MCC2657065.1 hypothetical protein [Panacagrimonas sp.]
MLEFPNGVVTSPTSSQRLRWMLEHHTGVLTGVDKSDASQARHLRGVHSAHEARLRLDHEKRHVVLNMDTLWRGLGLSLLVQAPMGWTVPGERRP